MTEPRQPSLASVSSLRALYESDERDQAAAVLWIGCSEKLDQTNPRLVMDMVYRQVSQSIPELRGKLLQPSPHAGPVRHILYEAVQVLEHNRLVLWCYRGNDFVVEDISLTRRGRAALMSGDIHAYLTQ